MRYYNIMYKYLFILEKILKRKMILKTHTENPGEIHLNKLNLNLK